MKKVLLFLVALLGCLYSANAVENEEYEVIYVIHGRTGKWLAVDTLFGNDIIYTENKAVDYAISRIPERFVDTSEIYYVYNGYHTDEKETHYYYSLKCYYDFFNTRRWKYVDHSDEFRRELKNRKNK